MLTIFVFEIHFADISNSVDDMLKKIDGDGALGEKAIERIFGYNSFLKKEGIQHTCADCFYLTYGVKFIK